MNRRHFFSAIASTALIVFASRTGLAKADLALPKDRDAWTFYKSPDGYFVANGLVEDSGDIEVLERLDASLMNGAMLNMNYDGQNISLYSNGQLVAKNPVR